MKRMVLMECQACGLVVLPRWSVGFVVLKSLPTTSPSETILRPVSTLLSEVPAYNVFAQFESL